ncbi:hypothetical protein DFJ58DRAFT_134637 [Suillus subalutaceus]|uniref:uncharacterized protein n=1 Tax=Suillus subalutaceus TaxID=48586 RepID=UPI001B86EA8E|nr:uncharacterized protein DFJ58DRAFT_134637 [Suillus subalutaceus]KAG1838034.1 hypothetical protein DFJ58DRAFT_134637 [Suillus subalutaceus]
MVQSSLVLYHVPWCPAMRFDTLVVRQVAAPRISHQHPNSTPVLGALNPAPTMTDFVYIHLSLPKLQDEPNLRWVLSFRVLVARILPWSLHPYALIRYMCFATTGARGELSLSSQYPVNPVAYNSPTLSDDTPDLHVYYHVQEDQRPYTFPINPIRPIDGRDTPTPTEKFKNGVAERDGGTCIVSHLRSDLCEAAHLIDVNNGNKYIEKLTTLRSLNYPNPQIIRDVDDLRNGLFYSY